MCITLGNCTLVPRPSQLVNVNMHAEKTFLHVTLISQESLGPDKAKEIVCYMKDGLIHTRLSFESSCTVFKYFGQ